MVSESSTKECRRRCCRRRRRRGDDDDDDVENPFVAFNAILGGALFALIPVVLLYVAALVFGFGVSDWTRTLVFLGGWAVFGFWIMKA